MTYSNEPVDACAARGLDCARSDGHVYFLFHELKDCCVKVCPICGTEYGEEAAYCSRDRSPLRPGARGESPGLIGQLVGERYQVERRLGTGGMGEVYLARHVLIGRACALKVMSQSLSNDPDALTRFNREATSASSISHPNVCAVYDFGLTGQGLAYLAMEYLEGRTLSALLEEGGPMPVERAAALVAQCAAGLYAAHELGILHRDLKPENIMVLSGKDRETAKLVDFGIAKAVEGPAGEAVTRTGFVIGTPEYMSPEQLVGDPLDARSDQYSLALVLYRLLTGRLPFEGNSQQETLTRRLTEPPRSLVASRPGGSFPAGLQAILNRALSRHAAERYPSVLEFAEAISAEAVGGTAPARKSPDVSADTLPPTRVIPAPGSRRSLAAVTAVGVLVVAGTAWGVLKLKQDTTPTEPEDTAQAIAPAGALPVDSGRNPAPARPRPVTAAPQPSTGTTAQVDTAELDPGARDSPSLRPDEIRRAEQQLRMGGLSARRRAAAAAFLGTALLDEKNRDSARILYRLAYSLDRNPSYLKFIRQLGDTIQP
jgi:serine/threonine protein kinase